MNPRIPIDLWDGLTDSKTDGLLQCFLDAQPLPGLPNPFQATDGGWCFAIESNAIGLGSSDKFQDLYPVDPTCGGGANPGMNDPPL